ncbi:MAG: Sterol-binding domain protein, partial [Solirubrobacterales bacterium]|nr:Sterol-binding domain protein [Solirubrobacterales bacterium]
MSVAQKDGIRAADRISYDDLYRRWEQGNWEAYAIDFSEDREGWRALTEIQRKSALWIYSMFFYGEDSVTDNLAPYIDAAPRLEQKYFLATQQVDEARHAVFFHRFFREVIGAGESISSTLAYTEAQLGWGYRNVFDRLDRMAEDLRKDRSLPNFARAIALYHMVVEATLAQPGQHYIEDYFAKAGTMPGFNQGMANVSRDEQRHIGFGVKVLSECFAESEECKQAVHELLLEVMPYSVAVFTPPGWDLDYTRCYGFELEDIFAFGLRSVRTKWRATGYPMEEMPGV